MNIRMAFGIIVAMVLVAAASMGVAWATAPDADDVVVVDGRVWLTLGCDPTGNQYRCYIAPDSLGELVGFAIEEYDLLAAVDEADDLDVLTRQVRALEGLVVDVMEATGHSSRVHERLRERMDEMDDAVEDRARLYRDSRWDLHAVNHPLPSGDWAEWIAYVHEHDAVEAEHEHVYDHAYDHLPEFTGASVSGVGIGYWPRRAGVPRRVHRCRKLHAGSSPAAMST